MPEVEPSERMVGLLALLSALRLLPGAREKDAVEGHSLAKYGRESAVSVVY